jgi:hypothetical protein
LAALTPVHNARRRLTLAKSARPSQIWAGRGSYPANAGILLPSWSGFHASNYAISGLDFLSALVCFG